ncbi:MAG: hypothetical protein GC168_19520 [Candidatus Hydrogenedens sp.]|nr:hypothetical protein [Candidatus Hydrogenedens sp.]
MTRFEALSLVARTLAAQQPDAALADTWRRHADEWPLVLEMATGHRVAGALFTALESLDLDAELAEPLGDTLRVLRDWARERNAGIAQQWLGIAAALNRASATPVALKGSGMLLTQLYPDAGDRLIGDIDILLPRAQQEAAMQELLREGYAVQNPDLLHEDGAPRGDIHYPPLAHPEHALILELHWRVMPPEFDDVLPPDKIMKRIAPISLDGGARAAVLGDGDALLYNILHAEERHHLVALQNTELFRLLDTLRLARGMNADELRETLGRLEHSRHARALEHHARMAAALFGTEGLPPPLQRPVPPRALRRIQNAVNGTRGARLESAARGITVALGNNGHDILRQWQSPSRRRALLAKLLRPGSYLRRARGIARELAVRLRRP